MPAPRKPHEYYLLPKRASQVAAEIRRHALRYDTVLQYRRTMWRLAWLYLNGVRRFKVFNPATGETVGLYLNEQNELEFQSQELLSIIDRAQGKLRSMDLRPAVSRRAASIMQIRDRAVGQVILNALVDDQHLQQQLSTLLHIYCTLGSVGAQWHVRNESGQMKAHLEIIHPRELMPFPALNEDITKLGGIMREQIVTVDWLASQLGNDVKRKLKDMEGWSTGYGEPLEEPFDVNGVRFSDDNTGVSGMGPSNEKAEEMDVVKIRYVWIDGPCGTCVRHAIASGDVLLEDLDLSGADVWKPISYATCIPSGTFHGIGLFELLFPHAREAEKLDRALFRNVRDLDQYGVVCLPHGTYKSAALREVGKGLRLMEITQDPMIDQQVKPHLLSPNNAGDMPGRTAQYAHELVQRINPIQDLLKEKGRADSAPALQFLDEQIAQAMSSPTHGLVQLMGSSYRALLTKANRELYMKPSPIHVSELTTDLAGIVLNPQDSTISFPDNPIPDVGSITVGVRQTSPRSQIARKQEALEMLKLQVTDPQSLLLLGVMEGLEFAVYDQDIRNSYEQVVRNLLLLYGDGTSNQEITLTPHIARPDIQLRIVNGFLASVQMEVASPKVVNDITAYKKQLLAYLGQTLPEGVPNPDDLAVFSGPQPSPMQSTGGGPPPIPFPQTRTA
jgi:hypothetical protein